MKRTNYEWLLNDCFQSIERLEKAYSEIDYILDEYGQELFFLESIAEIKEILKDLKKHNYDYETRRDKLGKIYSPCFKLGDVYDEVNEILTNENYHPHTRILRNEPLQIMSNFNEIRNARIITD